MTTITYTAEEHAKLLAAVQTLEAELAGAVERLQRQGSCLQRTTDLVEKYRAALRGMGYWKSETIDCRQLYDGWYGDL